MPSHLLHPQLFKKFTLVNKPLARYLDTRAEDTLKDNLEDDSGISIVVRAFNEAMELSQLLQDVKRQKFLKPIEIIVVDNGSTDDTLKVASAHGAKVVELKQEDFTYPYSLNKGLEAATHEIVFVTVAHTRLSNDLLLHAGARHFKNPQIGGVSANILPNTNATFNERVLYSTGALIACRKPAKNLNKIHMGTLAATNSMIPKKVWQKMDGYDEKYASGGEDTALATKMMAEGYEIIEEPALVAHHTHGLSALNTLRQFVYWREIYSGPGEFKRHEILARRPDLREKHRS